MHMPGHKRNSMLCELGDPYTIDITEIEGFDNLHQPEEILLSLSERISSVYGAVSSYPLVNGSTAGILTGITATVGCGDKVLVARNSHKAVYHGMILAGAKPVYCYPQNIGDTAVFGGILPKDVEEAFINHPDIRLVVITSPTYEGVVSDIRTIAEIVHKHKAYLLVDEAHGAHFGFHESFPVSAVKLGADLIIQSLHKTLPSLTQTAVLHCNAKELKPLIRKYLAIYQSSSPSYVLMAGIDQCIRLLEEKAGQLFNEYHDKLKLFYLEMEKLKALKMIKRDIIGQNGIYDLDPSKLTISVYGTGLSGHELHGMLHNKYQIMLEMEAPDYVLGMTSICDTKEGFDRLTRALLEIDEDLPNTIGVWSNTGKGTKDSHKMTENSNKRVLTRPEIKLLPSEAFHSCTADIDLHKSAGTISAAFISLFPPGAPILIPGEVITTELIEYVISVKKQGVTITGLSGEENNQIPVVKM